jgi:hypothetical protein
MDKFGMKKKLDNRLYQIYNSFSEIMFRLDSGNKALLHNNLKYKEIHKGESCYILGTGPSLSALSSLEIEHVKTHKTIAVNSYYKADISNTLTPDYYCLMDNIYWEDWSHSYGEIIDSYGPAVRPRFITDYRANTILSSQLACDDSLYLYTKKYPYDKVSCDLTKNVYGVMNVVSYAIISAIYLGFDEIYLLGCDYNAFCNMGNGHCYDDKDELSQSNYDLAFYLKFYWICTEFHYLISKLARENSVSIVNLTGTSLLDAYPRMSFTEHLKSAD